MAVFKCLLNDNHGLVTYYFNSLATDGFLIGFSTPIATFSFIILLCWSLERIRFTVWFYRLWRAGLCVLTRTYRDLDRCFYRRIMVSENAWFSRIPDRERIRRGLACFRRKTVIFLISLFFQHLATKDFESKLMQCRLIHVYSWENIRNEYWRGTSVYVR